MNRKRYMDLIICSFAAAIIILCFTYMEQGVKRDSFVAVCAVILAGFAVLAVTDSTSTEKRKRKNTRMIQEVVLLDEEGSEIAAWHIGGKTSVLIGRDVHQENVDINLYNTEYGGLVDRQHAVLNYANGQWYIEDLGSMNGVRIQDAGDQNIYQVSGEHLCRINAGDMILIGNTKLQVK